MKLKVAGFSHSIEGGFRAFLQKDEKQILSDIVNCTDVIGRDFPYREHWETTDPRLPKYFLDNLDRYRHFTEGFFNEQAKRAADS